MNRIILFVVSIAFVSHSQIKIAGEQDGVFDADTYIVIKDLVVPEKKNLEFLPGSNILFMPYTGIKVHGYLKIKGTKLSSRDSVGGRWNGVEVSQKGSVKLEDVVISRSILGISVPDSSVINQLENVVFYSNSTCLRITEKPVYVRDGQPFTIVTIKPDYTQTENKVFSFGQSNGQSNDITRTKPAIIALRWISVIAALSCTALCAYYVESSSHYDSKYDMATNNTDANSYYNKYEKARNRSIISGIGAGTFGLSLLFTLTVGK